MSIENWGSSADLGAEVQHLKLEIARSQDTREKLVQELASTQQQKTQLESIAKAYTSLEKQCRELRSALADHQFELRKVNQDIATEKTMMELQRVKFMKNYQARITQLKTQIQKDNRIWIQRFDIRDQEYRQELKANYELISNEAQRKIQALTKQFQKEKQVTKQNHSQQIKTLKQAVVSQEKVFQQTKQQKVKQTEVKLTKEMKLVQQKAAIELTKKQREYEIKISLIESEKKHHQNQHQNTKKEFVSVKSSLHQQVSKLATEKSHLQVHINQLTIETQEKAKKILALNNSIRQLEVKHDTQIQSLVQNSKVSLEKYKTKSSGNVQQILKSQHIYVETLQHRVKVLEGKHQGCLAQYTQQIENLKHCLQDRFSREDDLNTISSLKQKLWSRDRELDVAQEELKWFRLQLENKDDIYDKIFAKGRVSHQLKSITNCQFDRSVLKSSQSKDSKLKRVSRGMVRVKAEQTRVQKLGDDSPFQFAKTMK